MSKSVVTSSWKKIILEDYIESLESGKRPKGGAINEGVPSIGGEHLTSDGRFDFTNMKYIPEEYFNNLTSGRIKEGDILIVKDGATTGKVSYVTNDFPYSKAAINEHVFLIRTRKELNSKFLFYYLLSDQGNRKVLEDFRGATVGGISRKFVRFEFFLPPLDQQKKIVSILERAEKAIQRRKEADELADKYLQSVFIEMFGDPFINSMRWNFINVGEVLNFITSGSRGWSKYFANNGEIFITIQNVKNCKLDLSRKTYVNAPVSAEARRTRVKAYDLLISITADLGRTAVVDEEIAQQGAYINQHLALLRLDRTKVNPIFAAYCIESKYGKSQIERFNQSAVKAGLNFDLVKKIRLINPPITLQNKFVSIAQKVEKLKQYQNQSADEIDVLFKSLMQKAFRGELTANKIDFVDMSKLNFNSFEKIVKSEFGGKEFTFSELI
ncbi:MAG: hypothetical protein GX660_26960, partial [Clostridiaceae bacterium]|nr:hypothetical protein [Clostridiaceae bacterium]